METVIDKQKDFEYKVCRIFKFTNDDCMLFQRENGNSKMIIDDFNGHHSLSGTLAYNRNNKSFLIVSTYDSEENHISSITLKMIKLMIRYFCGDKKNKVILATNIPIDIHSSKAKELKKDFNFHIKNIGYSFCLKHNLEFTQMY